MKPERLASSFRDPSGFLFQKGGQLFRQVNRPYEPHYQHLMKSGLYRDLVKEELLVQHEETGDAPENSSAGALVIKPEILSFISYPYEWCFGQLKDAALTTLEIQRRALAHGMVLKDSSAYNIQFQPETGKPIFIDTLSFEVYEEGHPWVAYRQFCQHFLAPLALMSRTDIRLSQMLKVYIDGIPLDLASRLLPGRTRFSFGLLTHIHLHAAAQQRYAGKQVRVGETRQGMSRQSLIGLIDSLEGSVQGLSWEPEGTEWADYTRDNNYSEIAAEHKAKILDKYLAEIDIKSLWDLGGNTGFYSRLASQKGVKTIAFDIDPGSVELNYRQLRSKGETNLLPLVMDLTNPSPAIGWHLMERTSFLDRASPDAVFALALIHHLAIANNVPLLEAAAFFAALSPRLVIEFVPKEDSQVVRLLASRKDIFPDYTVAGFEAAFASFFRIKAVERIAESERRLYLMERI